MALRVVQAPPDKILGITENFKADPSPQKLNLGVGAYRTEVWIFSVYGCLSLCSMVKFLSEAHFEEFRKVSLLYWMSSRKLSSGLSWIQNPTRQVRPQYVSNKFLGYSRANAEMFEFDLKRRPILFCRYAECAKH